METSRGVASRVTTNGANDWFPLWSSDGQRILFASDRDGGPSNRAYLKESLESGSAESPLLDADSDSYPEDWSHDGKWIAFRGAGAGTGFDVSIVRTSGNDRPFTFVATPFADTSARFSPGDKLIAYVSSESGRWEVYVRLFSGGPATPAGKIQVSSNDGYFPVWHRDGKELFFIGGDLKLYSVKAADFERPNAVPRPAALFTPCSETVLASLPLPTLFYSYPYDVSPDGQRFLFNCLTLRPGRFDVMLNWQKAVK